MGEMKKSLLADLLLLSKTDSALAGILAEQKTIEKNLAAKLEKIKKAEAAVQGKTKVFEDKRTLTRMEEKSISEERTRLNERRKALKTLSTFKLQQSAEKEVDYSARQVNVREEALLNTMGDVQTLEGELKSALEELAALKADFATTDAEAKATLETLKERHQRHAAERLELAKGIDAATLSSYNRIKDKHAMNAVVAIEKGTCVGCYMQIGPQIIVQISRANALVRCPGCGRILYIPEEPKAEAGQQIK